MRLVLEWLGILEPERGRREPVAVPAWAPHAVAAVFVALVGALGLMAWAVAHAVLR